MSNMNEQGRQAQPGPTWRGPQHPGDPTAAKPESKQKRRWPYVAAVPLALFLGIGMGAASGEDAATATTAAEPAPTVTVTAAAEPLPAETVEVKVPGPTVTVTAKPAGPSGSIPGDGVFLVGSDIKAGTYRAANESGDCYWERLSGTSGDFDDILANDNASGPALVTIRSSDEAFSSARCGEWTRVR